MIVGMLLVWLLFFFLLKSCSLLFKKKTLMIEIDCLEKKPGKQKRSQIGIKLCFPFSKCCKNKYNFVK